MNKLTIISICIVSLGFFGTQALACDNNINLSASDFFYSESVDNNIEDINITNQHVISEVASPSLELSLADFFYGQPLGVQPEVLKGDDLPQRTQVAAPVIDSNTPEVFYGYTDVIEVKEAPCANC